MLTPHSRDDCQRLAGAKPKSVWSRAARRQAFVERRQASARTVFVSRAPPPSKGFRWEIRRFGTFVLKGIEVDYDTAAAARIVGEEVLEGWPN